MTAKKTRTPAKPTPKKKLVAKLPANKHGRLVVVRASVSGVWFGRLIRQEGPDVVLVEARRCWSWTGAGSCSSLALYGPSGGKIAPPVSVQVFGACEVIDATTDAATRFVAVPPWL